MRQTRAVAVSRAERRREREARVVAAFGPELAGPALDLLELVERAWHDSYGEITPPEDVVDDILLLSDGRLDRLIETARLAVVDWRDVRLAAQYRRSR